MRRDLALKNLIQPLAGEYGMHNNQPQREWGGGQGGGRGAGAGHIALCAPRLASIIKCASLFY